MKASNFSPESQGVKKGKEENAELEIIIVEDNIHVANEIMKGLQHHTHKIKTVLSWHEFEKIHIKTNQIYIIDLELEGERELEGLLILKKIREKTVYPPIIYSTHISEKIKQSTFSLGVKEDHFIAKGDIRKDLSHINLLIEKFIKEQRFRHKKFYTTSFHGESSYGDDQLNITPDVNAIANLIANDKVEPPLSIGVFADWGSGKSFFMQRLADRVKHLTEEFEKKAAEYETNRFFCENVLSIHFNTWHYIDANLWCSLLSQIIDALADRLKMKKADNAEIESLFLDLEIIKGELEYLEFEKEAWEAKVAGAKNTLEELKVERGNTRSKKVKAEIIKEENSIQEKEIEYKTEIKKIESQIKMLREGKKIHHRIPQMIDQYESKLGLISVIRKDLEELSNQFKEKKIPINRIVLFIDDLDRCPPARVVEVLQAIHLLLAFPIFVVVVGVDMRWVSHAIEEIYPNLGDNGKGIMPTEEEPATSFDYLEKIFQIPYSLKSLDESGVQSLVDSLLLNDMEKEENRENWTENDIIKEVNPENATIISPEIETVYTDESIKLEGKKIQISNSEKEYIHQLSSLLTKSPRAVKRYINTYRILRVHKEGPTELTEQKAVLLLLAIQVGFPQASQYVFRQIKAAKDSISIFTDIEFVKNDVKMVPEPNYHISAKKLKKILQNLQTPTLSITLTDLQKFIGLVRRFSFQAPM